LAEFETLFDSNLILKQLKLTSQSQLRTTFSHLITIYLFILKLPHNIGSQLANNNYSQTNNFMELTFSHFQQSATQSSSNKITNTVCCFGSREFCRSEHTRLATDWLIRSPNSPLNNPNDYKTLIHCRSKPNHLFFRNPTRVHQLFENKKLVAKHYTFYHRNRHRNTFETKHKYPFSQLVASFSFHSSKNNYGVTFKNHCCNKKNDYIRAKKVKLKPVETWVAIIANYHLQKQSKQFYFFE
jgi:hypothetical protein